MHVSFWSGNLKGRDYLEDQDLDGRGILKWLLMTKGWDGKAGVNLRIDVVGGTFGISKSAFCLRTRRGLCWSPLRLLR